MEEQQIIEEIVPKKSRRRKKLLYSSIKDQMEFYFSDVNLGKDRFIGQLIEKDPYIDLSVFLQFNKIRRLTDKLSDLCKAIANSEILELSEDNLKVCRKTPILVKENEYECTIYVERLPVDTEHDWLKNIFTQFGTVDYVSVPRYKHNRKIKGFAFIEFATPESAKKALEYFESIDCKLSTTMLPDQLVSISSFESETSEKNQSILNQFSTENIKVSSKNNESVKEDESDLDIKVKQEKRKVNEIDDSTETNEVKKNKNEISDYEIKSEQVPGLVQDINETEESKTNEVKKEKQKQDTENMETNETVETDAIETSEPKKDKENVETEHKNNDIKQEETEEQGEYKVGDESGEKRKRKRKKCKYNPNDLQQYGLQVLSKIEWKQLRNKYLNLQRQKMKTLKEHLYRSRFANVQNNSESSSTEKNSEENSLITKPAIRFEFIPGTIVYIASPDAFTDIKKFKSDIRSQPGLQYVDIKLGSNIGFIRFSDNESAKKFCESECANNVSKSILEGNEEKDYWNTILQLREEKFNKDSNKKQRGRDKLLRKAEKELGKHIRFDAE